MSLSVLIMTLSACQLVPPGLQEPVTTERTVYRDQLTPSQFCLYQTSKGEDEYNCQADYWLRYWLDADDMIWAQRQAEIELLSDTPQDKLRKVLLCQGEDTPYQDLLRAQIWAAELIKEFDGGMQELLSVMIYQPSQVLLEAESALVTLSKINGAQSTRIEEQQELIVEQRSQIEQLLKIEASIMDNTEGDPK